MRAVGWLLASLGSLASLSSASAGDGDDAEPWVIDLRVDSAGDVWVAGVAEPLGGELADVLPPMLRHAIGPDAHARVIVDRAAPAGDTLRLLAALAALHLPAWSTEPSGAPTDPIALTVGYAAPFAPKPLRELLAEPMPSGHGPARSPLLVRLGPDEAWVGRDAALGVHLALPPGRPRDQAVTALVDLDRTLHPDGELAAVAAADATPSGAVFDLAEALTDRGFHPALRRAVPEPAAPSLSPPPAKGKTRVRVPTAVTLSPSGRIDVEGLDVDGFDPREVRMFVQDCASGTCAIVAVPEQGAPVLIGSRLRSADPTAAAIFGRPVVDAPGYAAKLTPPMTGAFAPLPQRAGVDSLAGSLPKSAIEDVIQAHIEPIRYCYQRQRAAKPNLGGKLVIAFLITGDGTVAEAFAKSSELGDPATEDCVASQFLHLVFPPPAGGGVVVVSYPFLFSP